MPKRVPAIVLAAGLLAWAVLPAWATDEAQDSRRLAAGLQLMLPAVPQGFLHPEPGLYVLEPRLARASGAPDDAGLDAACTRLREGAEKAAPLPPSAVVLIHGLDDSGDVWRELAPALHQAGRCVLFFEYPNDQGVALSADALAACLRAARARGVERVDLVCHSMGGLVARDVLTREGAYAGVGDAQLGLPDVDRVVLIATPNAGAPIAWVRAPNDLIERTIAWRHADAPVGEIFRLSSDGDGQAGIDLRPGSAFLQDLNARPAPIGIIMTVIVAQAIGHTPEPDAWQSSNPGQASHRTESTDASHAAPSAVSAQIAADAPAERRGVRTRVKSWWSRVVRRVIQALGDGAVPTDSAALASADETLHVRCSHVGLLKDDPLGAWILGAAGQPVERAPAVALVLERVLVVP